MICSVWHVRFCVACVELVHVHDDSGKRVSEFAMCAFAWWWMGERPDRKANAERRRKNERSCGIVNKHTPSMVSGREMEWIEIKKKTKTKIQQTNTHWILHSPSLWTIFGCVYVWVCSGWQRRRIRRRRQMLVWECVGRFIAISTNDAI